MHSVETWVFGLANYGLLHFERFGQLVGIGDVTIFNCVYYSAAVFTTYGFGDIVPAGPLRFLTGVEAISGLTFTTWPASFTILDMIKTRDDGELGVDRDRG